MKKILSTVTAFGLLLSGNAMAFEFDQYVSLKGTATSIENKFSGKSVYDNKVGRAGFATHFGKNKSDTNAGVRLAYGVLFPMPSGSVRTELEYGYNGKAKLDGSADFSIQPGGAVTSINYRSQIKSQFLMANIYYDFDTSTKLTPYLGAGIGYARLKADNGASLRTFSKNFSKSSNNFAWNLTAGVSYQLNENFSIDASYRYVDYGKVKDSTTLNLKPLLAFKNDVGVKSKVRANEFNLGFRYTF